MTFYNGRPFYVIKELRNYRLMANHCGSIGIESKQKNLLGDQIWVTVGEQSEQEYFALFLKLMVEEKMYEEQKLLEQIGKTESEIQNLPAQERDNLLPRIDKMKVFL